MLPAALSGATAPLLASSLTLATGPSAGGGSGATILVAAIGAVSLIASALAPELFKLLRRGVSEAPAVVTPRALEDTEARILALLEARLAGPKATVRSTAAEVRSLRAAMEARDERWRDGLDAHREAVREELQELADELHRHVWSGGTTVPEPRAAEPA